MSAHPSGRLKGTGFGKSVIHAQDFRILRSLGFENP